MPIGLRIEDLPKAIRPTVLVLVLAAVLLVAGAGAYAGGMAKAQDVAKEAAAVGDAAVRRELDAVSAGVQTEKARTDERFTGVAEQIKLLRDEQIRTNQKLDRLIELQQGRR